jgi:hypothetical protein
MSAGQTNNGGMPGKKSGEPKPAWRVLLYQVDGEATAKDYSAYEPAVQRFCAKIEQRQRAATLLRHVDGTFSVAARWDANLNKVSFCRFNFDDPKKFESRVLRLGCACTEIKTELSETSRVDSPDEARVGPTVPSELLHYVDVIESPQVIYANEAMYDLDQSR